MTTVAEIVVEKWLKNFTPKERARLDATANQILGYFQKLKEATDMLANAASQTAQRVERSHERGELLRIYRRRRKWKKADIVRLETYDLNKAARKQVVELATARKLGRGAIKPFKTWSQHMKAVIQYFEKLHDPTIKGNERLRLLRQHRSWYPQFVEMTYRGEYERLKRLGCSAAYDVAEQSVADAFFISRPTVHKLCVDARKRFAVGHAKSPSITVAELGLWKQSGRLSQHYNKG